MNDLIISKIVRPDLYPKFLNANITPKELKSYLGTNNNELGMKLDPEYNSHVSYMYYTWLFLTENERFDEANEDIHDIITNYQHSPSLLSNRSRKDIPKFIQREWLDLFQFYKPDSDEIRNNN